MGRTGEGGRGGGECGGPDGYGSGAGTQERPAIEHEHVCRLLRQFERTDTAGDLTLGERTGTIDLHTLITTNVNGNNVSGKFHFQPQGSNLVGSVTGDVYQATGVTQGHFKGSLQNGRCLCGLGDSAGWVIMSTMRYFRDEYEEHCLRNECSAERVEVAAGA